MLEIYNSRNYWSILADISDSNRNRNIYNSRNYWSILAGNGNTWAYRESTIVEIIEAY